MPDPRYSRLAETLCGHSLALKPGENVLVEAFEVDPAMVRTLIEAVRATGASPFVELRDNSILRATMRGADPRQLALMGELELARMRRMDAYIGIRGGSNAFELSDVSNEDMREVQSHWLRPVTEQRVNGTRWVVLRWPSPAFAQAAGMSTEAFSDFYFDVCTLDYARMAKAQEPLVRLMERTDRVRIVGPGTDLTFSIKGVGARPCSGHRNIPDGECFSCPTIDSANGVIAYNAPAVYRGKPFDNIRLVLRDGVIVEATSSDTAAMNAILDSDAGARRIGEFAIGFNPKILEPMRDTLFDEKIAGSLHFTPGEAYESPGNGNKSQVHWDMVLIQRSEWGGGEIWFDDVCIRRDGIFLVDELLGLNPENLV